MVALWKEDERAAVEYARQALRGEPPAPLAWTENLSRPHLIQFAVEVRDALARMGVTGGQSDVIELLDSWEAVAELDAAPDVAERILRPREQKQYRDWSP